MATIVGQLQVNVTTGQATLTFDDAKKKLDEFGESGKAASEKLDYSMREARESIMLTGEALGVHLPAGITRVIASLGSLGPALEAALPAAAIIAAVALIAEHYQKVAEAQRKAATESQNLSIAQADETKALELTNLKLDDQIARLEHKAPKNYMAEALKETSIAVDQLAAKYASEFQKIDAEIDKNVGIMGRMKDAWTWMTTVQPVTSEGVKSQTDALWDVKKAMDAVEDARKRIADAKSGSKDEATAREALIAALKNEESVIAATLPHLETQSAIYTQVKSAATSAASEIKNLNLELEAGSKKGTVATLEQQAAIDAVAKKWDEAFHKMNTAAPILSATDKLKHVWDNFENERIKKQEEADKAIEESQKRAAERMQRIVEQETQINIQNFHDMISQIKSEQENLQAGFATRNAGLSGLGLDAAKVSEAKEVIAQVTQEMMRLQAERQTLESDRALLSPGDTADVDKYTQAINALNLKLAELKKQEAEAEAETVKLGTSWSAYFTRMKGETTDLGTTIRVSLENSVTQFTTGFANAMSKSIVEGKNFGQAMRQVAAQILESMLSMLIQWLEKWIITHTLMAVIGKSTMTGQVGATIAADKAMQAAAAGLAAANAMATAPFPIDLEVGPQVFGMAMAFAGGGLVPGSGSGDTVPAMLSPGEAVLPQPMVEKLSDASSTTGGGHYHLHYSPTNNIKAWDSSDMLNALSTHKNDFIKHVRSEIRRRHG
jgi:hypothetical protein